MILESLARKLLVASGCSRKYLILADVGGKIRFLWLRSNDCQKGIERLCRQMAGKLFARQKVGDLWFVPWPQDQLTPNPRPDLVKRSLTEQALDA